MAKEDFPNCLSLPGDAAPEKQVILDLKKIQWAHLDERFGIGSGTLYKYLDNATLLPDHYKWTTYIGNKITKSKDVVWSVLIEEWHKQCLNNDKATAFIENICSALNQVQE